VTVFLGVDGGGSKTALSLLTDQGDLIGWLHAPHCDYLSTGMEAAADVLQQGVADVCRQAGIRPADIGYAFFGLPTYGEVRSDVPALDAIPRAALGHDRYRCDNDMVCGWAGSLGGAEGINVISGTGSMAYGVLAGRTARVGGWGEVFGDEGSGYWIGARALQAFARMSDGRLTPGPLLTVMRDRLELDSDLDAVGLVQRQWHGGRTQVAGLAPAVVDAAREGDVCATAILADAGAELVLLAEATRRRLGPDTVHNVPVSWSGGIFNIPQVLSAFLAGLEDAAGRFDARQPMYVPAIGAGIHAAACAGSPLEATALQRLRQQAPRIGAETAEAASQVDAPRSASR
jgi:N-acetylglucosamine kinase-like BadF-type ATPase